MKVSVVFILGLALPVAFGAGHHRHSVEVDSSQGSVVDSSNESGVATRHALGPLVLPSPSPSPYPPPPAVVPVPRPYYPPTPSVLPLPSPYFPIPSVFKPIPVPPVLPVPSPVYPPAPSVLPLPTPYMPLIPGVPLPKPTPQNGLATIPCYYDADCSTSCNRFCTATLPMCINYACYCAPNYY